MTEEQKERKRARDKAWREANKERKRAINKAWREANKERARACEKVWREANKERERARACARTKAWYEANKERALARAKAWREANKEAVSNYAAIRRARMLGQTIDESCPIVKSIYAIARAYRKAGLDVHVDHVIPLVRGGLHHWSNLNVVFAEYNLRKGAKMPHEVEL
jgi:5-methylcytosine-specific restriction endonuclease McrA